MFDTTVTIDGSLYETANMPFAADPISAATTTREEELMIHHMNVLGMSTTE